MPHKPQHDTDEHPEDPAGGSDGSPPSVGNNLRKAVNTLAIAPKTTRITTLGRKAYNVLLYQAQEQGLEREVFRAPLDTVIKGLDFQSNDHELIKKHLRSMVTTAVEWQSPTEGEGATWEVSGMLAHAKLQKKRGQVWVEWSYAVNLKQELLEPTVFARLKLEVISQLRSHAGVVLYEICTRYKGVGRTARQQWRWWVPVLTGNPSSARQAKLEYRIFKRDTLKPAIAEVNAITDLEIELVEHREGRFIADIQFAIGRKRQSSLTLRQGATPVDGKIVARAARLEIDETALEPLIEEYGDVQISAALDLLERRVANPFPEPLRDRLRYLRAVLPSAVGQAAEATNNALPRPEELARPDPAQRRERWHAEWLRRKHEAIASDIAAMSADEQRRLENDLVAALQAREAHPQIIKRLQLSGWQHPFVRQEMLKFYGAAAYGETWDRPTADQILEIAAELEDPTEGE